MPSRPVAKSRTKIAYQFGASRAPEVIDAVRQAREEREDAKGRIHHWAFRRGPGQAMVHHTPALIRVVGLSHPPTLKSAGRWVEVPTRGESIYRPAPGNIEELEVMASLAYRMPDPPGLRITIPLASPWIGQAATATVFYDDASQTVYAGYDRAPIGGRSQGDQWEPVTEAHFRQACRACSVKRPHEMYVC